VPLHLLLFFLIFVIVFTTAFPVRFSKQGELKKAIKNFLGEIHVEKKLPKKPRGGGGVRVVFPLRIFFDRVFGFWPFLSMRSPKTPLKYFLKPDLKTSNNLKKSAMVPTSLPRFFFLKCPLMPDG
jgi:hypothetical protein